MPEKVTIRINNCYLVIDWNGRLLELVLSSKFRASLVPAAAVIPAELEMGNIVAVKTYVVTFIQHTAHLMLTVFGYCIKIFDANSASKLERLT